MNRTHAPARATAIGLLASLLTALGCQSTSPPTNKPPAPAKQRVEQSEAGRVTLSNGIRIVHSEWAEVGYRWEWSATPLDRGSGKIAFIDPMGDRVAVQSEDAWTSLLEANTGKVLWQVSNTSALTGFIGNERVGNTMLSCARPELFLMDMNSGNLLAREPVEVVISTRPVILGGLAVFGTPTGEVFCRKFADSKGDPLPPPLAEGIRIWGYLLEGAINADPVKVGELAGIVTDTGVVFFVDIRSGSGRGRARISGGMVTDPVTDGAHMFVASTDQSLYAFAPETNTYLWRYRTASPLTIQPTYHDGVLYCAVPGEGLIAFDVSENAINAGTLGTKLWTNKTLLGEVIASQRNDLIVWDGTTITRIDAKRGDVLATATLPGITDLVPGGFVDGDMYAVGKKGQLLKFGSR
jgi:outer membrane protein assembly factor BamB